MKFTLLLGSMVAFILAAAMFPVGSGAVDGPAVNDRRPIAIECDADDDAVLPEVHPAA